MNKLIIATRKSPLALFQANLVKKELLEHHPSLQIELCEQLSSGDEHPDVALNTIGGKELFAKRIQQTVLDGKAHVAVHSLKDLSAKPHDKLVLQAFLKRNDPRDAFISNHFHHVEDLPSGAVIGTASPRRHCLIHAIRPDCKIKLLRGNVQTRLEKLDRGDYDAIILAAAGLARLNLLDRVRSFFEPSLFIPAIGQGTIVAECLKTDADTQALLAPLNDTPTLLCSIAERAFNEYLGGDCFTPLGAYAQTSGNTLSMHAFLSNLENYEIKRCFQTGSADNAKEVGFRAAKAVLGENRD